MLLTVLGSMHHCAITMMSQEKEVGRWKSRQLRNCADVIRKRAGFYPWTFKIQRNTMHNLDGREKLHQTKLHSLKGVIHSSKTIMKVAK